MDRMKVWFKELSRIGKLSVISAVVLGGLFTASAMSPTPQSAPMADVQEVKAQPVVSTKVESETKPIAFTEQTIEDGNLTKGVTQVRTVGVDGVKTITYTITLTDGVETARMSSEAVTTEPVAQVTAIGTYVAPVTPAATSAGVVKKSRTSICHAPGTTYYAQTLHYTSYDSLQGCLESGGRMPKR